MRPITGDHSRASVVLSFADPFDISALRRLLYNSNNLMTESFALVDLPGVLLAGFSHTLKRIQIGAIDEQSEMPFLNTLRTSGPPIKPTVSCPRYASKEGFIFKLDLLRKADEKERNPLLLAPKKLYSDKIQMEQFIYRVTKETNLDDGQAAALCHGLTRDLSLTQGPPGTGKTFLGVGLVQVLLASRLKEGRKPILVVAVTNHALDSFLKGLHAVGISNLARLGNGSKEDWLERFKVKHLARSKKFQASMAVNTVRRESRKYADALLVEGMAWCQALNEQRLSWPAVREYLSLHEPQILDEFTSVEPARTGRPSELLYARRAGGFAFEYWCEGGDLRDITSLLQKFDQLLDDTEFLEREDDTDKTSLEHVRGSIALRVTSFLENESMLGIWSLTAEQRAELVHQWEEKIPLDSVLDRTVEIHRRYHVAVERRRQARAEYESQLLQEGKLQYVMTWKTESCH